jgi:hypothetical protein
MRASTILSEQCPPSTRPDVTSIAPVDLEAAPTEFDWTQSLALHLSGQRLIRRNGAVTAQLSGGRQPANIGSSWIESA